MGGKRQFEAIFSQGRTWSTNLVVLKGLPNGLEYSRYGFAAGKHLGKAVIRNRVKRRLRECVRYIPLKTGWDLVFVARQGITSADYPGLKQAILELVAKARLLREAT